MNLTSHYRHHHQQHTRASSLPHRYTQQCLARARTRLCAEHGSYRFLCSSKHDRQRCKQFFAYRETIQYIVNIVIGVICLWCVVSCVSATWKAHSRAHSILTARVYMGNMMLDISQYRFRGEEVEEGDRGRNDACQQLPRRKPRAPGIQYMEKGNF